MTNEKLFVKQADSYARARPTYPPALFQRLAALTPKHERAWDVGTGNGQAAAMIAEYFQSVVATDPSETQIALAEKRPNITYAVMSATPSDAELERVVGANGSVDLVTAATALHWFDLDKFYPIVKRVLRKPGGLFAAWTYAKWTVTPEVDEITDEWTEIVKPYRGPGAEYAFENYRTIPFPFQPIEAQARESDPSAMYSEKPMTLTDFLGLWESSSMTQTAREHGIDILNEDARHKLLKAWESLDTVRTVTFPTFLLMGTVPPSANSS